LMKKRQSPDDCEAATNRSEFMPVRI